MKTSRSRGVTYFPAGDPVGDSIDQLLPPVKQWRRTAIILGFSLIVALIVIGVIIGLPEERTEVIGLAKIPASTEEISRLLNSQQQQVSSCTVASNSCTDDDYCWPLLGYNISGDAEPCNTCQYGPTCALTSAIGSNRYQCSCRKSPPPAHCSNDSPEGWGGNSAASAETDCSSASAYCYIEYMGLSSTVLCNTCNNYYSGDLQCYSNQCMCNYITGKAVN